jgi:hypothetical protein
MSAFPLFVGLSPQHSCTVSVAVSSLCGAAVISTALVGPPPREPDMIQAPFSEFHIVNLQLNHTDAALR